MPSHRFLELHGHWQLVLYNFWPFSGVFVQITRREVLTFVDLFCCRIEYYHCNSMEDIVGKEIFHFVTLKYVASF